MKKVLLILLAFTTAYTVNAQIETPQPSPSSKLEQRVGLTDITIEYSRPGVKGRKIFGGLEAFDKIWRTGANARTSITFSTDATVDGQTLEAGTYAIFTKPGIETWEVYFYTDYTGGGVPQDWDDIKVAAKTTITPMELPFSVETLTFDIHNIKKSSATLNLIWDKTVIEVPFEVPTDKVVTAGIDKIMNGPDARDYYAAAVYYLEAGKDINKAKEWMDTAMSKTEKPGFWQLRQQSLIYAKAGDKKAAIEIAKESLAGAEKAGNSAYINMNKASLKEWGAM
ncbi:DUF2911 domain-containing protein [Algibacter sp.]|nr:DUF2911 domain-containing protein [Algibacter sp.]MDA9069352.1 DUF2911 domain-containing protein [Algibacter sp.]MDC1365250.1 DUF2911 domain-containing protein [Algibacter sp.]